ncbi:odorant receptor 47a-like isoform X2 [Fopius arisanus]|uniref:Odorant receptor 47a-like isoform X2 n=1 Tax=Fopius arisanus TaxID=64838 RepID=A0A9R1TDX2_9HYME|nr:PREDICTED: odorant receptor 47a-like isoform X2 [Fopius arisanus]
MDSSEKRIEVENEFKRLETIERQLKNRMIFIGTWPVSNPNIFYRAISIFDIICIILLGIMVMRFASANISNINLMVRGFSLGGSFFTIAFKIGLFVFHKETALELKVILRKYQTELLAHKKFKYLVLENFGGFRRVITLLDIFVFLGCLMYSLTPIVMMIIRVQKHGQPVKYLLPTPALYPWKIPPGGLLYIITYICETYIIWCMYPVTAGMDPMFAYFIYQITSQLRVMSYQMKNLPSAEDLNDFIRKWMMKFLVMKKCCDNLQKIYGPLILWQVITNSTVICTILFQILQGGASAVQIILVLGHCAGKIMQTYTYAWAGSQLTTESGIILSFRVKP